MSSWKDTYEVWLSALDANYQELVGAAAAVIPKLAGAAVLLLVGWLLALLLRLLILRLGTGLDRLFEAARRRSGQVSPLRWPLSRIVAGTVYWLTLLFFLTAAADLLGLPGITELLQSMLRLLPTVLITAALLLVVHLLSVFVAEVVTAAGSSAGLAHASLLGRLTRIFILVFAAIIAIGHLGVDVTLLVNLVIVVSALFGGGAALAFGLGAAAEVRNIIATYYLRGAYQLGQRVRIEGIEGEIVEFRPVAVVLETTDGRTSVPSRFFSEHASVLVEPGEDDAPQ